MIKHCSLFWTLLTKCRYNSNNSIKKYSIFYLIYSIVDAMSSPVDQWQNSPIYVSLGGSSKPCLFWKMYFIVTVAKTVKIIIINKKPVCYRTEPNI